MTIIPAEHRFTQAKEHRKLKLAFTRSIELANDEPPKGDAA